MPETNKIICKRCGACCLTVGRTFWKAGIFIGDSKPFGDIEDLNKWAMNGDHEDGGLPCEMFEFSGEKGVCLIHKRYGYAAKPITCRKYPDGELCFRQKGM